MAKLPTKKLKFLDIFFSLIAGIGIGFIVLVVGYIAFGVDKTGENNSFFITLTSSIVYLAVAFSFYLFLMRKNKLSFADMGFKKVPISLLLKMLPVGIGLFVLNVAIIITLSQTFKNLVPDNKSPLDSVVTWPDALLIGFSLLVMAPIVEEFFFRGIIFRYLKQRAPLIIAVLVSGVMFGALHDVIPALSVVGIVLALVYERYGSLYPAIVVHMVNNMLVMFFFLLSHQIK